MRQQRGLSLLEVLAAIVIFGTGAAILFGWIGQMATRLSVLGSEERQLFRALSAIEYARSINPMQQPDGEVALNDFRLRWTSKPIGELAPARTNSGARGLYVVGLYELSLQPITPQGEQPAIVVLQAGWRQVRERGNSLPFNISTEAPP